jgi:hypothetical protein
MFTQPLAPKHLVARVQEDDADVRAKAFTIQHTATFKSFKIALIINSYWPRRTGTNPNSGHPCECLCQSIRQAAKSSFLAGRSVVHLDPPASALSAPKRAAFGKFE